MNEYVYYTSPRAVKGKCMGQGTLSFLTENPKSAFLRASCLPRPPLKVEVAWKKMFPRPLSTTRQKRNLEPERRIRQSTYAPLTTNDW